MRNIRQGIFYMKKWNASDFRMWRRMNFGWIPGPLNVLCSVSRINMENCILVRWVLIRRILRQMDSRLMILSMSAVEPHRTMKGSMFVESSFLLISTSVMNGGSTTLSIRHIWKVLSDWLLSRHRAMLRLIRKHSTLRISPDRNMPLHSLFRDRMLLI